MVWQIDHFSNWSFKKDFYANSEGISFMMSAIGIFLEQVFLLDREGGFVHGRGGIGGEDGHIGHFAADAGDVRVFPDRFKFGLPGSKSIFLWVLNPKRRTCPLDFAFSAHFRVSGVSCFSTSDTWWMKNMSTKSLFNRSNEVAR